MRRSRLSLQAVEAQNGKLGVKTLRKGEIELLYGAVKAFQELEKGKMGGIFGAAILLAVRVDYDAAGVVDFNPQGRNLRRQARHVPLHPLLCYLSGLSWERLGDELRHGLHKLGSLQ